MEFVPIAPRQEADPKRFVSSHSKRALSKHSKRSTRTRSRRGLSEQDQRDVTVTPVFVLDTPSDDEKKKMAANLAMGVTTGAYCLSNLAVESSHGTDWCI